MENDWRNKNNLDTELKIESEVNNIYDLINYKFHRFESLNYYITKIFATSKCVNFIQRVIALQLSILIFILLN